MQDQTIDPKSMPRVSVIIASHNYGHWVQGAIASAVCQDYPNKAIYVVDDGSTDDTWDRMFEVCGQTKEDTNLIESMIAGVPFCAIRNPTALGPSAARNVAFAKCAAETDIFAILDADDIWKQGKISKSVVCFLEDPDHLGIVYSDYDIWNIHDNSIVRTNKEPYSRPRLMQECIIHSGSFISKKALDSAKCLAAPYDEAMRTCEDWDLWLRLTKFCVAEHIPESLGLVRTGEYNSTNTVDKTVWNGNWDRIKSKMKAGVYS